MSNTNFYICEKCGNLVGAIHESGVPMKCCGQSMTKIEAGVVEASREKHIPVAVIEGDKVVVTVGAVEHPMAPEHSIEWVYLQTDKGGQMKYLQPGSAPQVSFTLDGEKPVAVAAYCNLHGLWASEL